ncbi:MAG: class I SAM-dependent methyltransferase [Chloroflexi bacterium]|nr:class I SAM-dependent methyltransferase [Chloroflexota bacterium]
MDSTVVAHLLELNRQFYQSRAASFSATRGRANPGAARLLGRVPAGARVLDLGCGNGTAAAFLAEQGFAGDYLGLDASAALLAAARARGLAGNFTFVETDLTGGWRSQLPVANYQFAVCFATLHHLPGRDLRRTFLNQVHAALADGGQFSLSVWQFRNSPKLAGRVQPWAAAGLNESEVDEGDTLLDWRAEDEPGLRYVHHFSAGELAGLAGEAGFDALETFLDDGATGDLGLYVVWQKPLHASGVEASAG